MPEVLDQAEVDALLAAVDEGAVDVGASVAQGEARRTEVQVYDFKRPERVSKEQLRALTAIHEQFARNMGAALSQFMRTIVEVKLASVEQLNYSEFILSLSNPTCFALMTAEPLEGNIVLEINPSIIFPLMDKLLGGGASEVLIPERALTDIELRLVSRIHARATENLEQVWRNVQENIKFDVVSIESNPHLVQIVPPNDSVVLIGCELSMGNSSGIMNLCIPFRVIEPIMGGFSSQNWYSFGAAAAAPDVRELVARGIDGAVVEVTGCVAETVVDLTDILNLEPGDIISTDKTAASDLLIYVEGKPKFRGRPGVFRGKKAIQITRQAVPTERL